MPYEESFAMFNLRCGRLYLNYFSLLAANQLKFIVIKICLFFLYSKNLSGVFFFFSYILKYPTKNNYIIGLNFSLSLKFLLKLVI